MTIAHRISTLRLALLAGTALGLATAASAQDQNAANEVVIVTGTHIPRPQYDLPNPTISVGTEEIEHSGTTNLAAYLERIPALVGSLDDTQTSGFNTPASNDGSSLSGLNLLDLRNLGYVRTLVLVDGHRHVSESTGSAAVDIDTIPQTLVDHVEISTGGASAIYGADAVSGVVNFIMKHDLEGAKAVAQAGASQDGGGNKYLTGISIGHNFDDDKANVTATFEGFYQDSLSFTQRSFTDVGGATFFVRNPADHPHTPNTPRFIPTNNAQFVFSAPDGTLDTTDSAFVTGSGTPNFNGNGQPFNPGTPIDNATAIGSSGQPFANVLSGDFIPMARREIGQIDGDYEYARWFKVTAEFKYAHVDTKSFSTPPFDDIAAVLPDNAFLPQDIKDAINTNGQPATVPTFTGPGFLVPTNSSFATLGEDYLQLRRAEEVKRDTYRGVLSVTGQVPFLTDTLDNFNYELTYVYGQTDVDDIDVGNRVEDRFFAALDSVIDPSTGKPTCRSNINPNAAPPSLINAFGIDGFTDTDIYPASSFPTTFTPGPNSGCVAFNPFDPTFNNKASIAFFTRNTHTFGVLMQNVVTGILNADFDQFKNWGFAGPLSVAFGGEYRKESSASTPDTFTQQGLTFDSGTNPVQGSFDVKEVFIEGSLPVLLDTSFAKELSFDGAVRQSSYSTAGNSTSWKFGGIFSPVDGLKFRATEAFAVRAPNIGELFAPQQRLFASVNDPCDANNVFTGSSFRPANCAAIFAALGVPYDPNTAALNTGATVPAIVGGNPLLKPESARTVTTGVVLSPPKANWIATIDWYDVTITNAIEAPAAQDIANECVDLSTINNPFCAQVTRSPGAGIPGSITQVTAQEINVASFETDGVDFDVTYHTDTRDWLGEDDGSLNFHLIGNYLDKLTFTALPGEAPVEAANVAASSFVNQQPAPRWQANLDILWNFEQWTVDYNIDWYGATLRASRQTLAAAPDEFAPNFTYVPDRFVQGIQVNYEAIPGWTVYGGVDNLFYQKPTIGENTVPVSPLGRFFYGGIRANVEDLGIF